MTKFKVALVVSLLLVVLVASTAFAGGFAVVSYPDTSVTGYSPGSGGTHYMSNGDFSLWEGGYPTGWKLYSNAVTTGWEVHVAKMDYNTTNQALGVFVRTGSSGSQYVSFSQQVSPELVTGDYWVNVHVTAWEYNTYSPFNAVAWYGFGTSDDPASVTTWREMYPDVYVCENDAAICNHLLRAETVTINTGDFMHLRVGMKFPDYGAWTVFGIDDINITNITGTDIRSGWIDDGDVKWNPVAPR